MQTLVFQSKMYEHPFVLCCHDCEVTLPAPFLGMVSSVFTLFLSVVGEPVDICSNPPASASQVLGLKAHATKPVLQLRLQSLNEAVSAHWTLPW